MSIERLFPRSSRRSGGREARRSLRAAPLADDLRPVRGWFVWRSIQTIR